MNSHIIKKSFSVFVLIIFSSILLFCEKPEHTNPLDPSYQGRTFRLNGLIQKGPFISGSSITIQELDNNLKPSGTVYETKTSDDFGHYDPGNTFNLEYVEVIATGFYFDEVKGALSSANLTLRAIADLSSNDTVNVNVLTTLATDRIRYLVSNNQLTFDEARLQAENEVLKVFNISDSTIIQFDQMDISQQGCRNGVLLAASAILQGSNTVAELSELLSKINIDIENDGTLNSQSHIDEISVNAKNLSLPIIRQNLEKRYTELGLTVTVPNFENYVNLVWSNNPPSCSITSPVTGASIKRGEIVNVAVSASDSDGTISKVDFYIDSSLVHSTAAGPYHYNWNTQGLELKEYKIKVVATDDDNVSTSSEIAVHLESAIPSCQITSPQNGAQFTRENKISISVNASDSDGHIVSVIFFVDGTLMHTATNTPFEYLWDPSGVGSGVHTVKAVAKDNDDQEASDEITISIDYMPPTCKIVSPRIGSSYTIDNPILFKVEASDNDGVIESVRFYVDDALIYTDTQSPYSLSWNAQGMSAGIHHLKAVAKDNDGNETSHEIHIIIVHLAPTCQITSPQDGSSHTTENPISITVSADDVDGTVQSVDFYLDDVLLGSDTQSPYSYQWNANGVNAGMHTLKAVARDNDGNETSNSIQVNIVYIVPTCQITSPQDGSSHTTENPISITVNADDSDGTVQSVGFYLDDVLLGSDTQSPYSYQWNANGVSAGMHTLKAVARDNDGNETSNSIHVHIIYNAPTCQITSPLNNSSHNKLSFIDINVNSTDSDGSVISVEFYIDDTLVNTDTNVPYSYAWNPAGISAGQHMIKATARDNHGNTTDHQIAVNILSIAPTCQITAPQNGSTFIAGDNVNIQVEASDTDGNIQDVKFYIDNALISTDDQLPFHYTWNSAGSSAGYHNVRVVATDDDNRTGQDELNISYVGSVILISPLSGTTTNDRAPTFMWQQNSLASLYTIIVSTNADLSNPVVRQEGLTGNIYTIQSDLPETASTAYYWGVEPTDANGGIGPVSSIWDFTLDTQGPEAPNPLEPANTITIPDITPTFEWNAVNDAFMYEIQVDDNENFNNPDIIQNSLSNAHYTHLNSLADGIYYWHVRCKDIAGNWGGWSNTWSFTIESLTDIDGNRYQVVKIGNQWWMAENLKVTRYRNGEIIPNVPNDNEWDILRTGACCNYDNDPDNAETYGLLYNFYAVEDNRNIAPDGWHVASHEEWKELEMFLGMSPSELELIYMYRGTDEGGKLKETGTIHWNSPNSGATNESGFTALPGGFRWDDGLYDGINVTARFWTSTKPYHILGGYPLFRALFFNTPKILLRDSNLGNGYSVRCVKN